MVGPDYYRPHPRDRNRTGVVLFQSSIVSSPCKNGIEVFADTTYRTKACSEKCWSRDREIERSRSRSGEREIERSRYRDNRDIEREIGIEIGIEIERERTRERERERAFRNNTPFELH